jgi:hypothetical protein
VPSTALGTFGWSLPVLDVVFIAGILALVVVVALVAKGVERL